MREVQKGFDTRPLAEPNEADASGLVICQELHSMSG